MEINNDKGFTLAEALKEYPKLKEDPMYNEYGFAGESIFVVFYTGFIRNSLCVWVGSIILLKWSF